MSKQTLSAEEQHILDKFYAKLDNIQECETSTQTEISDWDNSSYEFRLIISIENNSLSVLGSDYIRDKFINYIDFVKDYLNKRLKNITNYLLIANYNYFLYCLTRHNKYGEQAIEQYNQLFLLYIENSDKTDLNRYYQRLLEVIINLTQSTKYKMEKFKELIHNILKEPKINNRKKTRIIDSISKTTLFKIKEIDYLSELCCNLAKKETDYNFIEINLQLGLQISKRLQNTEMQRIFNELLGDNEYKKIKLYDGKPENIIIPHNNSYSFIKIIQYYKNSKNEKKRDKAILEYNLNKKNCKTLKINSLGKTKKETEKQTIVEKWFFSIISSSTKQIILHLIIGDNLMFITDEYLEKYAEKNKNNIIYKFFPPKWIDINNNVNEVDVKENLKFQFYSSSLLKTIDFVSKIIMISIANKKLSYKKLSKFLHNDFYFGKESIFTRNDKSLSYTWFSMIDIGLKSFFKQCKLLQKNKEPDWRFSIDFLSLKFEGILRDIICLVGVITKVDNKGNTTDMLLDDLLRSNSINKIFSKDDLNLFQYTFTRKGLNIRHNVAHSFYKPQDYKSFNAVLVFLCILRLSKFNISDIQNQSIKM
jgi:hypothetical protein